MFIELRNKRLNYLLEKTEYIINYQNNIGLYDINYDNNKFDQKTFEDLFNHTLYSDLEKKITGGFLIPIYNENKKPVRILRNKAGIKTAYYTKQSDNMDIGTNAHKVAQHSKKRTINNLSSDLLLSIEFLPDGRTYYEGVHEYQIGIEK